MRKLRLMKRSLLICKGSNDSSVPSSTGDGSYEENDRVRRTAVNSSNINSSSQAQPFGNAGLNSLFGKAATVNSTNSSTAAAATAEPAATTLPSNFSSNNLRTTANINTSGDTRNSTQSKQQQQQRMQDAKHELELCRVSASLTNAFICLLFYLDLFPDFTLILIKIYT